MQYSGGLRGGDLLDRCEVRRRARVGLGLEPDPDHTRRLRGRDHDDVTRTHADPLAHVEVCTTPCCSHVWPPSHAKDRRCRLIFILQGIIIAACYADAMAVCLSVCLSHPAVLSERRKLGSRNLDCREVPYALSMATKTNDLQGPYHTAGTAVARKKGPLHATRRRSSWVEF